MPTPKVTVYTKQNCPYCVRAKALLGKKGVTFEEISVEGRDDLRGWLVEKTGQMTVPQVFAGARSLGGYSDLAALDADGKLDPILHGEG
jgi:glutaredoxin 3